MGTHLFQALALGLLLIVILVLLVAISMLGKIRAALEANPPVTGAGAAEPVAEPEPEPSTEVEAVTEPPGGDTTTDEGAAEEPTIEHAAAEEALVVAEPVASDPVSAAEADSERPYEEGGRWYYRRGGELLVYEEGTGEWVPAGSSRGPVRPQVEAVAASSEPSAAGVELAAEPEPVATPEPQPEPQPQPQPEPGPQPEPEPERQPVAQPSTSFGGQPIAPVEDLSVDEPALEATQETPAAGDSFWKCTSCGAVNGSTAATCRMCFAPRP